MRKNKYKCQKNVVLWLECHHLLPHVSHIIGALTKPQQNTSSQTREHKLQSNWSWPLVPAAEGAGETSPLPSGPLYQLHLHLALGSTWPRAPPGPSSTWPEFHLALGSWFQHLSQVLLQAHASHSSHFFGIFLSPSYFPSFSLSPTNFSRAPRLLSA